MLPHSLIEGPVACRRACFGEGTDPIHYANNGSACNDTETKLIDCARSVNGGLCDHSKDAGVICGNSQ